MYCPNCGKDSEGNKFCGGCGTAMPAQESPKQGKPARICPKCKCVLWNNEKKCKDCGTEGVAVRTGSAKPAASSDEEKDFEAWRQTRRNRRIFALAVGAPLLVIILFIAAFSDGGGLDKASLATQARTTSNSNITRMMDKLPISRSVAEDVLMAMQSVGINEVPWRIESSRSGDVVFAFFVYENADVKITINANGCNSIAVNSFNRIFSKTGDDKSSWAKGHISDYTLTSEEMSSYTQHAFSAVRAILKSPASADFELGFFDCARRDKNVVRIMSYVDAQNAFGALLRANFEIKYSYPFAGGIDYFMFDGEVLIEDGEAT